MVGAMDRAFEIAIEWAFDRYSFGRPLASYQELKHRFADMKSWLEAGHAIADAAARAVQDDQPTAGECVSAAKAYWGAAVPSWCTSASRCTAASGSPSTTTCTCTSAGGPRLPSVGTVATTASGSPPSSSKGERAHR